MVLIHTVGQGVRGAVVVSVGVWSLVWAFPQPISVHSKYPGGTQRKGAAGAKPDRALSLSPFRVFKVRARSGLRKGVAGAKKGRGLD